MGITKELLEKFHEGRCTPEEAEAVKKWLSQEEIETAFPADMDDGKTMENEIWKAMSKNLALPGQEISATYHADDQLETDARTIPNWLLRIAAGIVIAAGLGYSFWTFNNGGPAEKTEPAKISQATGVKYVTFKTAKGERKQYTLPDGSQVTLNADSEIRHPELFLLTDTIRQVYLNGEAFFSVTKDPDHPFKIETAGSVTRVLGTRFNLRAYQGEGPVSVVVEEGKVRFSALKNTPALMLTANQRGTLRTSGKIEKDNVYAARYFGWRDDRLVFENQPLSVIAKELERWYAVQIYIENPAFLENHYTGSFESKPLEEVLSTIQYAVGYHYKIANKKVSIY